MKTRIESTYAGKVPHTTISRTKKPIKKATFSDDVRPFAMGVALAAYLTSLGLCVALLVVGDETKFINASKLWWFPFAVSLIPAGLSYIIMLIYLFRSEFKPRQWTDERTHESVTTQSFDGDRNNVYWLKNKAGSGSKMPPEPDKGALARLAKDIIEGQATFSELGGNDTNGARNYGYSSADFQTLRAFFLKKGLAEWRNKRSPQQGVKLTEKGEETLLQIASTGLEQTIPQL